MKLRISGNSLRLRLLRGEVEQFGKTGRVAETIQFGASPSARFSYILETDGNVKEIVAGYADNQITVKVPEKAARDWVESEKVALQAELPIERGKQNDADKNGAPENVLKITIEKDLLCLDRKDDPDNIDAFTHPTGKCG